MPILPSVTNKSFLQNFLLPDERKCGVFDVPARHRPKSRLRDARPAVEVGYSDEFNLGNERVDGRREQVAW